MNRLQWALALALGVSSLAVCAGATGQEVGEHPSDESAAAGGPRSEIWARSPGRDLHYARMRQFALPLNNPSFVAAADATHMRDEDIVLGVQVDGMARAYPWWILTKYHVANDRIGEHPVYVAICDVCSGGAAFSPIVDGHYLSFQLCGLSRGSFEVCDWETGSRWRPFSGRAYEGVLAGERLEQLSFVYLSWADWRAAHPDSTVVLGNEELRARPHGLQSPPGAAGIGKALRKTVHIENPKLGPNVLVFGVIPEGDGHGKAYPLDWLRERGGLVQDVVSGRPILLLQQGALGANAYLRRLGKDTLDMRVISIDPLRMRDAASGTLWTATGLEVRTGADAASKLPPVRGYVTEWYKWLQSYPRTEVAD